MYRGLMLVIVAVFTLVMAGCAGQGQGPNRTLANQGFYVEHLTINLPQGATPQSFALFSKWAETFTGAEQDVTHQPAVEGSTQSNEPSADIDVSPVP